MEIKNNNETAFTVTKNDNETAFTVTKNTANKTALRLVSFGVALALHYKIYNVVQALPPFSSQICTEKASETFSAKNTDYTCDDSDICCGPKEINYQSIALTSLLYLSVGLGTSLLPHRQNPPK